VLNATFIGFFMNKHFFLMAVVFASSFSSVTQMKTERSPVKMIEKQSLSDEIIISCLNTNYGIEIATLTLLPLGADMNSSVYKAQTPDQSYYFIKLKLNHHNDISVVILELLQMAGIQQIIPPIKTIHGQITQNIEDFTLIVYPFVEGQNGFSRNLTANQWLSLGKTLRQIHEIDVPTSIQNKIRRETYSSKWREIVRSLYTHIEAKPASNGMALKLLKFMKEKTSEIRQLVDRAEQLGKKIKNLSPKFVLCHSDIHAGNVLIDGNDNIYIVDWDDPIMAPKERDLMFVGGGVANVWNNPHEEKLFYNGYGKTEVNPNIMAYYRHERIAEDIAIYGQELLLKTSGGGDRPEMYKHFKQMFAPNGVVDIAFKTDEG
jgi:spectinomycin phosphotransferase